MSNINIDFLAQTAIENHLEATYPNEGCGFLLGSDDPESRNILAAYPVRNVKEGDQRRRFSISASDYKLAEQYAERYDLQLLGIYHSHPDHPAIPSEHDLKQAAPYFSYFITAVKDGKAKKTTSWQLNPKYQFEEERINVREPRLV